MKPCEEGSDEHLLFCSVMEELESLCGKQFACFLVLGYTSQVVAGTMFQAKIRVSEEGDTPIVHCKVWRHLPHTGKEPELMAFKNDQTEDAPFNFTEMDGVMRALAVEQPMTDETANAAAAQEAEAAAAQDASSEPQEPQGQSISGMVNQSEVSMIMDMGFSRNVAEKACFMVQGAGVERAMEWIENNRNAPDFEEALMIVGQAESAKKPSAFAGLSKEEKAAKIKELQA